MMSNVRIFGRLRAPSSFAAAMLAASAAWAGEFTLTVNDSGAPAAVACSPAGGVYDDGSVVSVTAPGEGFVKWIGDVDAQSESNATISVTMDADKTLVPLYHRMWVLEREGDATSGFIREVTQPEAGHTNWLLNVREISNSGKTIRIGNATNTGYRGHAYVFDGIDIIGNGKMDLSTKVVDADGNSWTIEKIVGTALGMDNAKMWKLNKVRANTMTECIFPTTLTAIDSNILDNDATMTKTLTNVVMVCPNATGYLRNWFFNGQNQLKRLTLKCPKITYMQKCIFQSTVLTDTDVGEWDLSGIERITEGQTFLNFKGTGVLRLPRVREICDNAFKDVSTLSGVELGIGNTWTVQSVGTNTFGGNFGVKRLVIGGADGWVLKKNAIALDKGLTQLVFAGALPARLPAGETYFNGADTAAKSVCFYVNEFHADGSAALAAARPLTPGEAANFMAANPGAWAPTGVIGTEVFGTRYEQFIGKFDFSAMAITTPVAASVYDPRYGDTVEMTVVNDDDEPVEVGQTVCGYRVTVRAVVAEGNEFAYWDGVPEGAEVEGEVVRFTVGMVPVNLTARIRHTWRWLDKNTEENPRDYDCISDGVWTLYARVANASRKTIKLGRATTNYGAYTGVGSGMLDLNGKVVKGGDDGWRITEIPSQVLRTNNTGVENPQEFNTVSDLIVPENVEAIGNNLMSVGGIVGKSDCVLTNAVVNVPEYTGAFDVWMFNMQQNLKTLTLNAPKVTRINQGMFNGCYSLVADASEWRLDGVEIIGSWSVPGDAKVTGELCLPSLTNVTRSAGLCYFDGTAFKFGTKYRPADGAVFSLATATNCFVGCLKVTRLELGAYAGADFYDNAFAGLSGLKEIVFHGRPFERAQLDKLFAGVGDLKVVMRASQLLGWQVGKLAGMRAATQAELDALPADAEASRVTGVYETADGKRAWVVHRASEWDPKGIVLIVR